MPQEQPKYVEMSRSDDVIRFSKEFKKKRLCTHTLDIGFICDHGCTYCSTPSIMRTDANNNFKKRNTTAQKEHHKHIAYVDLETPEKVTRQVGKCTKDDTVMICAKVDPYSPAVQEAELFQKSLRNLLENNSECRVRILSKNAKIVDVMEEFLPYADRISFSLSITAPRSKAEFATIVEPNASSIPERLDALHRAKEMGFTIYGMICPCCPDILTDKADLKSILDEILPLDPEAIWFEPVNGRGGGLGKTEEVLAAAGKKHWAKAIHDIRKDEAHDQYVADYINTVHELYDEEGIVTPTRILIYDHVYRLVKKDDLVIWLSAISKQKDTVRYVHVDALQSSPDQPRKHFDKNKLKELAISIGTHGVLQPIIYRETKQSKKIIVAGERRVLACRFMRDQLEASENARAGDVKQFEFIPAINIDDKTAEIGIVENIQRDDLNPVELASALASLKESRKYTQADLAAVVGLGRSTVTEILSINKLPEEVLDEAIENNNVSRWMLVEVAKCSTPKAKLNKWKKLKDSGITQGEYKAAKKAASPSSQSPTFNVKSGLRLLKGTSTLVQKINTTDPTELSVEERKNLRGELLALQSSLQAAISVIGDDE